ncbi:hypothetical protein ACFU53_16210 [Streptomyces sp. NPDC057474]|uniref:hypothetical protein n=1 Tax=Streptomyces sp. NPDC057474 TaxID=3346144 RepID=UPI0036A72263
MEQMSRRENVVGGLVADEWHSGRRVGLPGWLLITKSRDVAEMVAELYQGTVSRAGSDGHLNVQMPHTESFVVDVADSAHIENRLILVNKLGLAHVCNGSTFLAPGRGAGDLCGCPDDLFERKAAARVGTGPRPDASLVFRLAVAPKVGDLSFASSAWQLYESLEAVSTETEGAEGVVRMVLSLRERRLVTRSGADVAFTYPEAHSVKLIPRMPADLHLAA